MEAETGKRTVALFSLRPPTGLVEYQSHCEERCAPLEGAIPGIGIDFNPSLQVRNGFPPGRDIDIDSDTDRHTDRCAEPSRFAVDHCMQGPAEKGIAIFLRARLDYCHSKETPPASGALQML